MEIRGLVTILIKNSQTVVLGTNSSDLIKNKICIYEVYTTTAII